MTMPHLMNCLHSCEGWCIPCVKEMHEEVELLCARVQRMEKLGPLIDELKQAALAFRDDYEGDTERETADTTRLWTAEARIDAILSGSAEATVNE